jgi:hypothetical protein
VVVLYPLLGFFFIGSYACEEVFDSLVGGESILVVFLACCISLLYPPYYFSRRFFARSEVGGLGVLPSGEGKGKIG